MRLMSLKSMEWGIRYGANLLVDGLKYQESTQTIKIKHTCAIEVMSWELWEDNMLTSCKVAR